VPHVRILKSYDAITSRYGFAICGFDVAGVGHLAVFWSDRTAPRIFCHAYELQAKVANSVEGAVEVGLIADLADEDALLVARFDGKPLECGGATGPLRPTSRPPRPRPATTRREFPQLKSL
jgi:hypothetical protein